MLESRKELVALESSLSSASTKRSPFHLLSSIFSKKKQNILDNDVLDKTVRQTGTNSSNLSVKNTDLNHESVSGQCFNNPGVLEDPNGFRSPIAKTRRKNLKIDLETLHLSRQDNPYLKQLERFSLPEETLLSCALAEKDLLQSEWQLTGTEKDVDIHQHLVRSPPPQFPQNLSCFMYSQANSPKRQINQIKDENSENLETEGNKKSKSLNPIQTKREMGLLDPGIREVLEYQKSQFRAGLQHSSNTGQAKFGTAPAHYVPVENIRSYDSKSILIQDSGCRFGTSVPTATISLPSYLDLEQASKKVPLGPIRIGRTLSDSICLDNNFTSNAQNSDKGV